MLKKIWRFIWKAALFFFISSIFVVIIYRFVPVPYTLLMFQRCFEQKMDNKQEVRLKKEWISLDQIPNNLQLAVICSEDQNFLWHHGFDFGAIEKAVQYNEKQKSNRHPHTRGASTISQQCAKNVFLVPARNFIRKGLEVYFTGLIELCWSKKRIMEVYLNVIEMGNGIYGAEAAAQFYFHKHAGNLTNNEAALITASLPDPRKFNPAVPSPYVAKRAAFILNQMALWGGKLDYNMKEIE